MGGPRVKVLSAAEMRAADAAAIEAGIPAIVLMENAAYAVLRQLEQRYAPLAAQRIAVFCGKGNNGGDGLAVARLLYVHHQPPSLTVILAFEAEELTLECTAQLHMLEALGIPYTMQLPLDLPATTLAIDALLGTGQTGEMREPIAGLVAVINGLPLARRVAIDVPTGAVRPDLTVTFTAPKLEQGELGEVAIVPIGIPVRFVEHAKLNLITKADLRPVGAARARNSHKGSFGHAAILGGAPGKNGALNLAGEACLRGGAGLVTLFSPDPGFRPLLPDLMLGNWPNIPREIEGKDVLAVGPGLGTSQELREFTVALFRHWPAPLVLDADALNNLAPLTEPHESKFPRVLTPHPGEMKRLLGRDIVDRIEDSRGLSVLTNSIIVLKGQRTIIALPDGQAWVNLSGSPALAKGGSGDVLTGLIAAFLSQYRDHPTVAVLAAVYLHGRCGELAASHGHEMTSLASRLCDHLPEALHELG